MFGVEKPLAHKDSTHLPPISQVIGRQGSPQYEWHHSSSPARLLDFHMLASNDEHIPSVEMQEHRSSDALIESTTDMGLPSNPSILLAGDDNTTQDVPASFQSQGTKPSSGNRAPTPEEQRAPELTQNTSTGFIHSSDKQSTKSPDTRADAMFLLNVMSLGDVEMANGMPTLGDLHDHLPVEPWLREKAITALLELQLSDQIICLGAALIPRACCLRRSNPIFPRDSPWYDEEETAHATIAVALRVAQRFLEREVHDTGAFYTIWGFYPYDDLAQFARKLADPENKTPITSVDWDQWCALKREFERAPEFVGSKSDVMQTEGS